LAPAQFFSRDVEDLGRPLITVIRDGKLAIPVPGATPDHVAMESAAGRLVIRVEKGKTFTVGGGVLRIGSGDDMVIPADMVDAITIETTAPPSRAPWLKLAYRLPVALAGAEPRALHISTQLAAGLPLASLQWLQRFLLRGLAGLGSEGP
jgi:hypothetical protein